MRDKMYVHMFVSVSSAGSFNVTSLTHTLTHTVIIDPHPPRVPGKVERQFYNKTPSGVGCLAPASLIF